jgi:hypothetical protein
MLQVKIEVLEQRYEDVIVLNTNPETNGGYEFSNIRWFKDGNEVVDARGLGYLHDTEAVAGHVYHVIATTQEGEYQSCDYIGQAFSVPEVKVAPNPVKAGETITVTITDSSLASNATVQLVSLDGHVLVSKKATGSQTLITAPNTPGMYIIRVITNGAINNGESIVKCQFKVIVK